MRIRLSKKVAAIAFAVAIACGYFIFAPGSTRIYDFDYRRDMEDVAALFERNRYWLTSVPDSSIYYSMRNRSPHPDPMYWGQLITNVMRDIENNFIGFVSYYMETRVEGKVLFLTINEPFRGRGYSDILLRYAVQALRARGASAVTLVTRVNNFRAQKIYYRMGFQNTGNDAEFTHFRYRF